MCGLSGVAGAVSFKEETVMKTLLNFGVVRGSDSTGIGSVERGFKNKNYSTPAKIKLAKEVGPPWFLFDTNRFNKVFAGTQSCMIGHNRSKTVGDATVKNAHPFQFDHVLGAHNGTVDHGNKSRMEGGQYFNTDSEAIFNNIEVHGIEDTVKKFDRNAAYALSWYDSRDNTVNILRNELRPLLWTTTNDGKTLWWCSEYGYFMAALYRHDMVPDFEPKVLTPNQHLKWVLPDSASEKLPDPARQKLEFGHSHQSSGMFRHPQHNNNHEEKKKTERPGSTQQMTGTTHGPSSTPSEKLPVTEDSGDENGLVYGGLFVGLVPKKSTKVMEGIRSGLEKLKEGLKDSGVSTPLVTENRQRIMTAMDVTRKKAWDHAVKAGIVPIDDAITCVKRFEGTNIKVWRNSQNGLWTYLKYEPARGEWSLHKGERVPPTGLPLSEFDPGGSGKHCFRHVGKGKHKKIYFKGVKTLLTREQFEHTCQKGCYQCRRQPAWGNEISFVSQDHDFLCEWCMMTPGLHKEVTETINQNIENNNKKVA